MEKKRSIGVTIIGILSILGGVVGIGLNAGKLSEYPHYPIFHIIISGLAFGMFSIFTGIGLLRLKEWARKAEIILCILGALLYFSLMVVLSHGSIEDAFLAFFQRSWFKTIIAIIIIIYLTRPKVKEQFK